VTSNALARGPETRACDLDIPSLYQRLAEEFTRSPPSPAEVRERFGNLGNGVFRTAIRDAPPNQHLSWSSDRPEASGADLVDHADRSAYLHCHLRYCAPCLRQGFHSAIFQHVVVQRCPYHQLRLQSGCPSCGAPISTSIASIARSPFCCDQCGVLFKHFDGGSPPGPAPAHPTAARVRFAAVREALAADRAANTSRQLIGRVCRTQADHSSRNPHLGRALQQHLTWSKSPLPQWPSRWETRHRTRLNVQQAWKLTSLADEAERVFCEIAEVFSAQDDLARPSGALFQDKSFSARIDLEISVLAAAYWKTRIAYCRFDEKSQSGLMRQIIQYGTPFVASTPPLNAEHRFEHTHFGQTKLIRAEVLGFVGCMLLDLSRLTYAAQLDWRERPELSRFCPAWHAEVDGELLQLRVRSRFSMSLVARLARRYGNARLLKSPDEMTLLRCVQSV